MRVTTVTATLRYSAEARGAWRSIEVGAEATLTASDEDWRTSQATLYQQLGQQLKTLWNNGTKPDQTQELAQPEAPAPPKGHWCVEHQTEYKKRNGPHGEFYSHKIQGTENWCNESNR